MKTRIFIYLLIAVMISSCGVVSLHPLFTKETLIFRNDMLGEWIDKNSERSEWKFEKDNDKESPGYLMTYSGEKALSDELEIYQYDVHLVKLDQYYFLDFERVLSEEEESNYFSNIAPLLPAHSFAKIEFKDNEMKLYFFDAENLEKLLEQQKIRIKHERLKDDTFVLTASSEELQKFVVKYANQAEAFEDATVLKRKAS